MNCNVMKKSLTDADDRIESILDNCMRRLKGKVLNLFEATITDPVQRDAIKKLLQSILNEVVIYALRELLREVLLSVARKNNCSDISFKSLTELRGNA